MNSFGYDNRFSKIWYYRPILIWSWSCLNKCSSVIINRFVATSKRPAATIFHSTLYLTLSLSELHRLPSELWNHSVETSRLKLPTFPRRGGTMQWEEGRWHAWRVRASGGQRSWITLSPNTDTMACLGLVLLAVQQIGMRGEQGRGGLSGSECCFRVLHCGDLGVSYWEILKGNRLRRLAWRAWRGPGLIESDGERERSGEEEGTAGQTLRYWPRRGGH